MTDEPARPTGGGPSAPAHVAVRAATVEDATGIAEVHVAAWQAAYRGLLPQALLDGLSVEQRTTGWHRTISAAGRGVVHVATDREQRVVGFVHTCRSRDDDADDRTGELTSIYLRPELWDRGVGSRLHDAAIAALAADFEEATLWVLDGNARSRAFYERKGWRPDGSVKRDAIGVADVVEVHYRRPLNGRRRTS
jgi:RimJ/RimL family protein N-acetyltransferase